MLAVAAAGLLAIAGATAAAPDTPVRLPGTALRFGASLAQVQRVVRTQAVPGAFSHTPTQSSPGAISWQTRLRFFGLDGAATLEFEDSLLVGAAVTVDHPSPHDIDYVEDDLVRRGFHRRCEMRSGINRSCEWTARARVRLTTSETNLVATLEPLVKPPPRVGTGAAALPETLRLSLPGPAGAPDSLPGPVVLDSCRAVRPEIARQSGVFGRVMVEVSVDTTGRVVAARIARGVPMLDEAALECARRYRFAPCLWRGRAYPFRVALPIRFTL